MLERWNGNSFTVTNLCGEMSMLEIVSDHEGKITNKTDLFGDHKGSWQGLERPTLSEEGMRAIVESLMNIGSVSGKDLQKSLTNIKNGETFYINGDYTGEQFTISNKNNVVVVGSGVITQQTDYKEETVNAVSQKPLFRITGCNNITIIGMTFSSIYECIDITGCKNVKILSTSCDGKNNTSKFNGIVARDSANITIENSTIANIGVMPSYDYENKRNNYSEGNGIAFYKVDGCYVINCDIIKNAKNGIYTFGCSNVINENNRIVENGMSGVQYAFATGLEKNFIARGNVISFNYSDGIDIYNSMSNILDINCVISDNIYNGNGWFGKNKDMGTQDGSGVATLIGVKNIDGTGNIVNDCYRTGLYINNCEDVNISCKMYKSSKSVGNSLFIGKSLNVNIKIDTKHDCLEDTAIMLDNTQGDIENININNSSVRAYYKQPLNIKGENKFINVSVNNTLLYSYKDTSWIYSVIDYNSCIFESVEGCGAYIGYDNVVKNCKIISHHNYGIKVERGVSLIGCEIITPNGYGVIIENVDRVQLINCRIISGNNSIKINNTQATTLLNNTCKSDLTSVLISGVTNIRLFNNIIQGGNTSNSLRVENGVIIYTDNNIFIQPEEFTTSTRYNIQWV